MQLIFIHGSGGSREAFHYQIEHFPQAVALNLPGHPKGELCATVEAYADWLHAHMLTQGYRDVVLAGHSMGGGIGLALALKYPQACKGLILIGSGLRLRVHPMFIDILEQAMTNPQLCESMLAQTSPLIDPALAQLLQRRALENGPAVMLNDMRACDGFDLMERAKEIRLPTLAICGADDTMTPPKYSQFMAQQIPGARVVIIEGGTHFVFAEKPNAVNQAIADFISHL